VAQFIPDSDARTWIWTLASTLKGRTSQIWSQLLEARFTRDALQSLSINDFTSKMPQKSAKGLLSGIQGLLRHNGWHTADGLVS